ncbi:MAG: response regulator, partial [Burkholderiales bacterium]|nr:response regulator [Burkholderiales bacterium]
RAAVFDPFVQGDDSLSRGHGGAGLGLAIARALARAMGGDVMLDAPPPGGGTRFTVQLTLAATPQPALPPAPPPGLAWLLYIDPQGAEWLGRRLGRLGWRSVAIGSVAEALARTRDETPQLVVLTVSTLRGEHRLAELRAALPEVPIRLLIRPNWLNPALEADARALGIVPAVAPLTPLDLHHITAPPLVPAAADDGSNTWPADAEVLLVEDNPVNQLIGKEFLGALGLPARTANDGAEAIAACLAKPPSLVLMDLQMPGMDGLEAARRLRELQREKRWPGAPIIALTAHAGDADRVACLAAGMDGVLTKPLSIDTLRLTLRRWLVPST